MGTRLPLIARLVVLLPRCERYAGGGERERRVVHVCRCGAWRQTPSRSFLYSTQTKDTLRKHFETTQRGTLEEARTNFSPWGSLHPAPPNPPFFSTPCHMQIDLDGEEPIAVVVLHVAHHRSALTSNKRPVSPSFPSLIRLFTSAYLSEKSFKEEHDVKR